MAELQTVTANVEAFDAATGLDARSHACRCNAKLGMPAAASRMPPPRMIGFAMDLRKRKHAKLQELLLIQSLSQQHSFQRSKISFSQMADLHCHPF